MLLVNHQYHYALPRCSNFKVIHLIVKGNNPIPRCGAPSLELFEDNRGRVVTFILKTAGSIELISELSYSKWSSPQELGSVPLKSFLESISNHKMFSHENPRKVRIRLKNHFEMEWSPLEMRASILSAGRMNLKWTRVSAQEISTDRFKVQMFGKEIKLTIRS